MTREEALAIYHAGPETVVRVLLEMDARIHALERQVQDLTVHPILTAAGFCSVRRFAPVRKEPPERRLRSRLTAPRHCRERVVLTVAATPTASARSFDAQHVPRARLESRFGGDLPPAYQRVLAWGAWRSAV